MPGLPATSAKDMMDAITNLNLAEYVMVEQDRTMTDEAFHIATELKDFMIQSAVKIEDAQARIEHANAYIQSSLQLTKTVVQDCNAVLENLSQSTHENIQDDNLFEHQNQYAPECEKLQDGPQVVASNHHHTESPYQHNTRTHVTPEVGTTSTTPLPGNRLTPIDVSPQPFIKPDQVAHADQSLSSTAGELKRQLSSVTGINYANNKKLKGDSDPENQKIYLLRQKENLTFDEIANIINTDRISAGRVGNISSAAVYNRYKRNCLLIAMYRGEAFKPCQLDEEHGTLRDLQKAEQVAPGLFNEEEDKLLVKAVTEIKEEYWKLVSERLEMLGGQKHTCKDCADRFARIGLV